MCVCQLGAGVSCDTTMLLIILMCSQHVYTLGASIVVRVTVNNVVE